MLISNIYCSTAVSSIPVQQHNDFFLLYLSLFCQQQTAPFYMTEEAAEKESLLCDQWPKPVSHLCHHHPHKDKSWFLNSSPPPLSPSPPTPPPPPHTESLGITRPEGKMLDGLFVSADRGGSVSFDDDWLTNWQTLCLAEYDVEVNRGHIWLQDLVWFPYQCHFFFLYGLFWTLATLGTG